jgi:hypothetical protein
VRIANVERTSECGRFAEEVIAHLETELAAASGRYRVVWEPGEDTFAQDGVKASMTQ